MCFLEMCFLEMSRSLLTISFFDSAAAAALRASLEYLFLRADVVSASMLRSRACLCFSLSNSLSCSRFWSSWTLRSFSLNTSCLCNSRSTWQHKKIWCDTSHKFCRLNLKLKNYKKLVLPCFFRVSLIQASSVVLWFYWVILVLVVSSRLVIVFSLPPFLYFLLRLSFVAVGCMRCCFQLLKDYTENLKQFLEIIKILLIKWENYFKNQIYFYQKQHCYSLDHRMNDMIFEMDWCYVCD